MEDYLKLTKKLISVPSVSSNQEQVKKCAQIIIDYLGNDFIVQKVCYNGFTSLVISREKKKKHDVFLYGHLDVVPATQNQFIPNTKNGRLYGRGSLDMKSAVAVQADILKKDKTDLSLALVLVPDEEIGGENGLKQVLSKGFTADLAIVPDAGFGKSIVVNEKGVSFYKVKAFGKGGHGSRPWTASNPVLKLYDFYFKLIKELKIKNSQNDFGLSVNLGRIISGERANQIPELAEMDLDFRFSSEKDRQRLKEFFNKKEKESDFVIKNPLNAEVFNMDSKNNYLGKFKKTAEAVLGSELVFSKQFGASDARFFSAKGIPVINYQPVGDGNHQKGEYVDLNSLKKFHLILSNFLNLLNKNKK